MTRKTPTFEPDQAATLERALAGYDVAFRHELAGRIISAIADASTIEAKPAPVMALRTTETLEALADVLVMMLIMVPAMSEPAMLAKTAEALAARVRREVAQGRAEGIADILGASGMRGHA